MRPLITHGITVEASWSLQAVTDQIRTLSAVSSSTPYEQHRDYVLSVLARRCGWLDPSDREALLHDAYTVFLEKQRDGQLDTGSMRTPQVRAYLTQTALNKAMDEGKRAGRRRSVSLDNEELGIDPIDPGRELDDRLASSFDDARIREIVAELPERQQMIIKLRFFFDRTPEEVQRYLGVTERVYRRELERASRHIARRVELVRSGEFCESRRSLILAYVNGVAGPHRVVEARRHLATCPGCATLVRELRATVDRAAMIVPAPLLADAIMRSSGRWSAAIPGHAARMRMAELASKTRTRTVDAAVRLDPAKAVTLAGARPGAAAALVAGCLAAGSGATYCAVNGVPDPLRSLIGADMPTHHPAGPARSKAGSSGPAKVTGESAALAPPPKPLRPSTVTSAKRSATPARRREVRARASSAQSTPASTVAPADTSAEQIHRSTSAEFGVGGGNPVPASPTPERNGTGGKPPPAPTSHLPEFDP